MEQISNIYIALIRYILPLLIATFLIICAKTLLTKSKHQTVAMLIMKDTSKEFTIHSYESIIGRGKLSDVILPFSSISVKHAVITITKHGAKICPIAKNVAINEKAILKSTELYSGDTITLGTLCFEFSIPEIEDISSSRQDATPKEKTIKLALVPLISFQILGMISLLLTFYDKHALAIGAVFFALILIELIYAAILKFTSSLCIELIGFFLTTIGFMITATLGQENLIKQAASFIIGLIGFILLSLLLRKPRFCEKIRYFVGAFALALLAYTLLFGTSLNGSKSWIFIGNFSFEPSEFVKVAFIFASAATLERLITTKNLIWTLAFSFMAIGALGLMHDFGAISIFFVTMMIILFMGLCDKKTIISLVAIAAVGGFAAIKLMGYITIRFESYRHAWEFASSTGYQQTRTMIGIANGGLFGLGSGKGYLSSITAADTDLVFGVICEELGLIVGLCCALCFLLLAVVTIAHTTGAESTFYPIAGCAAAGLLLFQTSLNIFGSVDLLPFTGVTMPFISNGGTSMIASWLLLSYIKAQSCTHSTNLSS